MTETERLIFRIKRAAKALELETTTMAFKLLGSGTKLRELENGKTITLRKYEHAMAELDRLEREHQIAPLPLDNGPEGTAA